jgi:tRNA (mo5U34)-methyltransferase
VSPAPARTLAERVGAIQWYHTLELAPGLLTPGWFDHRGVLAQVPLPASLAGMRCLDVGTFNGYWAFAMERRGGQVTAIDVLDPVRWDWPAGSQEQTIAEVGRRMASGDGFRVAHEALGSAVQRLDLSVYDLDPERIGVFDFVYVGSLLVHLRDPVRALERVRSVCRGRMVLVDGIDLPLTVRHPRAPVARFDGRGRPWWWLANASGLRRIVEAAGYEVTAPVRRIYVPPGAGWNPPRLDPRLLRSRVGREALTAAWRGDPHAVVEARPRV